MKRGFFLLSSLLISNPTWCAMSVYPMEASVTNSGSAQIEVESKSNDVQFVRVTVKKIINPGTKQEKEISVGRVEEDALVITPQKLAITAGGMRVVRALAITLPKQETTWRVYFEGVSENEYGGNKAAQNSADVGVSIIWGVLVHVAPEKAVVSLKYDPVTGTVVNDGTIRIPLNETAVCAAADKCIWRKEKATVYPGTSVKLSSTHFNERGEYRAKYYNWISNKNEEITLPVIGGQNTGSIQRN